MIYVNRLRELREDRDLTQKEVAQYLKVDQSNYSKYELEKISIPMGILMKLSEFYGTSIDYLLYRTDIASPYPKSIVNVKAKEDINV